MRLIINSKDRINTDYGYDFYGSSNTPSNFIHRSNFPLNFKGFHINKLVFPHSWYYINNQKNNNKVTITDSTSTDYLITIPNGSYNASDLAAVIQTQLNNSPSTDSFTVTVSNTTGKITLLNNTNNWGIKFSESNLYKVLGFPNQDVSGSTSYTSSTIIKTSDFYINLNSRTLSESTNIKPSSSSSIIATIPVDVTFGSYIIYEPPTKFNALTNSQKTESDFDFYFTDADNKVIDFNGIDCLIDIVLIE